MLSVLRVHLPSEIPIVGCELTPYVLLRRPDGSNTHDDIPETAPVDGFHLRYRWYRIQSDKRVPVCSVHPSELATLQCMLCVKAKLPVGNSYHCSSSCFLESWTHHKSLHARAANTIHENNAEEEELFERFVSGPSIITAGGLVGSSGANMELSNGSTFSTSALVSDGSGGGETWYEVGRSRTYTPTADDVGHELKLECTAVDSNTGLAVAPPSTLLTARVIPAPSPTPRRMVPLNFSDGVSTLDLQSRSSPAGTFTVLSYNVLADLVTYKDTYSYCPPWALSWQYRRQNLLREILAYRADILCLQEVQSDHFDEFFAPELEKQGYVAVYKKKTTEVEFNKAAQSMIDAHVPTAQKKMALSRLLKDNVALIVVLEARDSSHGASNPSAPGKRQLLCVANTHIHANPELKDVKLWQVHTLLKGLEKIAASADIPMLVCGDFNSVPGSAPHSLLATGRVDPSHPDLTIDPLGILRPTSKLCHQLLLVSAYSAFARLIGGSALERQRLHMDPASNEPLFTNYTREFLGTLDYIFFTVDSLAVESLLELLDEEKLRKDTALPSPEWSSDHIALLAEFRCTPRPRR